MTRLALIQQKASTDRERNRESGADAARQAAERGANIVCFAELAFDRFYPQRRASPETLALAEPVPGPTTDMFAAIAREYNTVIVLNLFESSGKHTYDCSPVIGTDGSIMGVTRMVHITDYPRFHETDYYHPGDTGAPVYDTPFGRLGVAICYDRHYPEYMRALGLARAQIVVVPQAGTRGEWPPGLYHAELQVASFQNGYYSALCNRVGVEESLDFAGESFVCDPAGRVIAKASTGSEEILTVDIDPEAVSRSHAHRLFYRDRRPELYSEWLSGNRTVPEEVTRSD